MVLLYWPQYQQVARQVHEDVSSRYAADLDQLESDALDFLISTVQKLTDRDYLTQKVTRQLSRQRYLSSELMRKQSRRHHKSRGDSVLKNDIDFDAFASGDSGGDSIEQFLDDSRLPLDAKDREILKAVMYKRSGETIAGVMARVFGAKSHWAANRWHKKLLPRLREWVRKGGL